MLNRIILIGRLTRDPELRYTPSGAAVATFTLAVDRRFSNQHGERETDFIRIVVWQKLAETCANYIEKGRLVGVEGRLQTRSYDDKEGIRRNIAEVVADNVQFLEWPRDDQKRKPSEASNDSELEFKDGDIKDDDIPF
ncbi:MAG: single-stranded DNA-binding protein [Firmicutes bacterium]|mgnify:CR=1 FL=1|jgi:single-strand DNA-binding protein|nr:single-stranded DNA-binding protein [Bacillota bacterium]